MTIREFFKKVVENNIDMDMELTVEVKGMATARNFKDLYIDGNEAVLSQYEEEPQEVDFDGRDEFFLALAKEVEQGAGEMLDSMKINGVR